MSDPINLAEAAKQLHEIGERLKKHEANLSSEIEKQRRIKEQLIRLKEKLKKAELKRGQ